MHSVTTCPLNSGIILPSSDAFQSSFDSDVDREVAAVFEDFDALPSSYAYVRSSTPIISEVPGSDQSTASDLDCSSDDAYKSKSCDSSFDTPFSTDISTDDSHSTNNSSFSSSTSDSSGLSASSDSSNPSLSSSSVIADSTPGPVDLAAVSQSLHQELELVLPHQELELVLPHQELELVLPHQELELVLPPTSMPERPINTFCLIIDNIDKHVKSFDMRLSHQSKSLHFVNSIAVIDRIDVSHLSSDFGMVESKKNLKDLKALLPATEDFTAIKANFSVLISRVLVEHMPKLHKYRSKVTRHIPHKYSREMSSKSTVVSLPS